jgi:hypothetical protein
MEDILNKIEVGRIMRERQEERMNTAKKMSSAHFYFTNMKSNSQEGQAS